MLQLVRSLEKKEKIVDIYTRNEYNLIIMTVEGINEIKEEAAEVKLPKEDTKMSVSHLLMRGFVEDVVEEGLFTAKFKSLTTEQVHEADSLIVLTYGTEDHRASRNARYMKYLARSLEYVHIKDGDKVTDWNFANLDYDEKEKALKKMSSFIFNKIFAMYIQFENTISELLRDLDVKNS